MRGKLIALTFLMLCLAIAAPSVWAVVQGTHHDLKTYGGGIRDVCYPCHGYKADSGNVDNTLGGTVGTLCYLRCHNNAVGLTVGTITVAGRYPALGVYDNTGNGAVNQYTGSPTGTYPGGTAAVRNKYESVLGASAHGYLTSSWPTIDNAARATLTWPYVGDTRIQCTSCHDVHSNTFTPFLRANAGATAPNTLSTGTNSTSFCQQCHPGGVSGAGRYVDVTATATGAHPSEVTDYATAAATRATPTGEGYNRQGRTIVLKDVQVAADNTAVFRNRSVGGTTLNSPSAHYRPGGKLGRLDNTAGDPIGCYTCHAVHLPGISNTNALLVMADRGTLTTSPLCEGCHGPGPTPSGVSDANPGRTNYYHPVNHEAIPTDNTTWDNAAFRVSTGTFNIRVNINNTERGAYGRLVCLSCHAGGHSGVNPSMMISTAKPNCASCHAQAGKQGLVTDNTSVPTGTTGLHHVYGGNTNYTTYGYPATINYGGNPAWTASLTNGLSCEDCHAYRTAHNW